MNKIKKFMSNFLLTAIWGVAVTTLTSTSRYFTYQPEGEEELMRKYL